MTQERSGRGLLRVVAVDVDVGKGSRRGFESRGVTCHLEILDGLEDDRGRCGD